MIRIVVRSTDVADAANGGGPVRIEHKTFEIIAPRLEAFLQEANRSTDGYLWREVVGAELVAENAEAP